LPKLAARIEIRKMFRDVNGVMFALQLVDCEKINILHIVLIQDCCHGAFYVCFVIWYHSHACKILCIPQRRVRSRNAYIDGGCMRFV